MKPHPSAPKPRSARAPRSPRHAVAVAGAALALAAGLTVTPTARAADDYPSRPVRWVVPFAPGAANDSIARLVATGLSARLNQSFVVDNRAGAGGALGAQAVASAAPDGYTLLLANPGPNVSNPILMKDATYRINSFDAVINFGYVPLIIVTQSGFPADNPRALVAYLKANPGKVNWGSSGTLSNPHIALELFRLATQEKFVHVPYKGSGPALNDLLAGQIQAIHTSLASVEGHLKSGRLKAIGIAGAARLPQLPNVQTLAEAGIRGAESATWFGMAVPAGTPRDIVVRLNTESNRILQQPEARAQLEGLGLTLVGGPPQNLDSVIESDAAGLRKLVASGALKPE